MDAMESIIKIWTGAPFCVIKTGIVATFYIILLGIYAAEKSGQRTTPGKKAVIDGILTLPMVQPPTVAGFFLLLIFSKEDHLEFFCMRHLTLRSCSHGLVVLLQQPLSHFR